MLYQILTGTECNLRCKYCYEHNKNTPRQTVDNIDVFLRGMFKRAAARNFYGSNYTPTLDIIGGETLMYLDLADYTLTLYSELLNQYNLIPDKKVVMATNGTLISKSKEIQEFLNKWKDLVGLSFSIDGAKEAHDKYRVDAKGKGSWNKAISGAKWVMKNIPDMRINARITITKENIDTIGKGVIDLYKKGFRRIGMRAAVGFDYWEDTEDNVNYVKECLLPINDYLLDHPDKWFAPYHLYYKNVQNVNGKNYGCNCGNDCYVTLGTDGLIYHCMRMATCESAKYPFARIDPENYDFVVLPDNPTDMLCGCWRYSPVKCQKCSLNSMCGLCVAAVIENNPNNFKEYYDKYSLCSYTKGLALAAKDYYSRLEPGIEHHQINPGE